MAPVPLVLLNFSLMGVAGTLQAYRDVYSPAGDTGGSMAHRVPGSGNQRELITPDTDISSGQGEIGLASCSAAPFSPTGASLFDPTLSPSCPLDLRQVFSFPGVGGVAESENAPRLAFQRRRRARKIAQVIRARQEAERNRAQDVIPEQALAGARAPAD